MQAIYQRIDDTLDRYGDDEAACVLGVSELDGFLHAVACAPNPIVAEQWLPAVWGGETFLPAWSSPAEAGMFEKDVMAMYQSVVNSLERGEFAPLWLEDETSDKPCAIADEWCEGFYLGIMLWGPALEAVPDDMLEPILFFTVDLDAPETSMARLEALSQEDRRNRQAHIAEAVFELRHLFGLPGTQS